MARPKQFDADEALGSAVELFWTKGYDGTSVADLCTRLRLSKASLYATFGSKRELYIRALDRYMEGGLGPTAPDMLSRSGSPLAAVRALVDSYAAAVEDGRPRGCLVVNATVQCPPGDDEISQRLERNRAATEAALVAALLRAREQGELSAEEDPVALAKFLLVVFNGMQAMSRAGEEQAPRLRAAAAVAFRALR